MSLIHFFILRTEGNRCMGSNTFLDGEWRSVSKNKNSSKYWTFPSLPALAPDSPGNKFWQFWSYRWPSAGSCCRLSGSSTAPSSQSTSPGTWSGSGRAWELVTRNLTSRMLTDIGVWRHVSWFASAAGSADSRFSVDLSKILTWISLENRPILLGLCWEYQKPQYFLWYFRQIPSKMALLIKSNLKRKYHWTGGSPRIAPFAEKHLLSK